jgi:peptide/nickel transport system substrate-binding protein
MNGTTFRAAMLGAATFVYAAVNGGEVLAQHITMTMPPPGQETNLYWATTGDFTLRPALQGLVGHDPETGFYDNSELAESWEHNEDFTEWTFTLHEGAEFHNGWGPVTAEDVAHSLTLHIGPDSNIIGVSQLFGAETEVIDERTIKFILPAPQVDFLFAHGGRGSLLIYSKAQFDAEGLEGYDRQPVGSGRFSFGPRTIGQGVVFNRVDDHWSGSDAPVETLEFRFVAEPATTLAMLLSGETDIATLPRELQPQAIEAGYEVVSSTNASNQTSFLFNGTYFLEGDNALNPDLPWLDIRIREAVNRAIDRETLIDVVYDGRAEALPVFGMDPRHEGYREDLAERFEEAYGYDPERAKELLAEAGYPENFAQPVIPILITQLPGSTEFPTMAELMQVFLDEAGFQTEMIELDWAGLGSLRRARTAQLFHPMRNLPVKPSAVGIDNYLASHGRPNNPFEHPDVDALVDEYKVTIDPEARERLAGEIFAHAFDLYANVPLASLAAEVMVNPDTVEGWLFPGVTSGGVSHFENIVPRG